VFFFFFFQWRFIILSYAVTLRIFVFVIISDNKRLQQSDSTVALHFPYFVFPVTTNALQ